MDASTEGTATARLESLVRNCLGALAPTGGDPPSYVHPEVTAEEATAFFRAIDSGLFVVEPDGQCRSQGLRAGYYCYPLLYRPQNAVNAVILWREWLTHAGVAAALHLDYGYPVDDIALDVDAFDVLVYSRSNRVHLAVEAKKSTKELDAMLAAMKTLEGKPWLTQCNAPRLTNAAKKFRGLVALRPRFFLAVCPTMSHAYEVRCSRVAGGQTVEMAEIDAIPGAGEVES